MPLNLAASLGTYETMLKFHSARATILASNIANADTPNYAARDIDFDSFLRANMGDTTHLAMRESSSGTTLSGLHASDELPMVYRLPQQTATDGNTVDIHQEKMQFADNALQYQASVTLLDGKLKGIISALRAD
jgi:flagellar basal-body rod protein FlgB